MNSQKAKTPGVEILIAEDSATQREQLRHMLAQHGHKVTSTTNGREALEAVRRRKPTLIISDIVMPELDGYSFVQDSKTKPDLKPCPIIVLTAKPGFDEIFKIEGAKDYIVKPFDDKELLEKIRKHLGEEKNA